MWGQCNEVAVVLLSYMDLKRNERRVRCEFVKGRADTHTAGECVLTSCWLWVHTCACLHVAPSDCVIHEMFQERAESREVSA